MRWTVWHRRTKCSNCGARIPVPEDGLTMSCQYCGVEVPVPDVERRKKKRATAAAAQEPRKQREGPGAGRRRRGGFLRGLLRLLILLALIGAVLHFTGLAGYVTEPLFGDDGGERYASAVERLQKDHFVPVTRERVERCFVPATLYLEVEPGFQHALVLASGQPIKEVVLSDPTGRVAQHRGALRYQETLRFTPAMDGVYTATVVLDRPGRYIWALHRGPSAREETNTGDRPAPVSTRGRRGRRRRPTRRPLRRRRSRDRLTPLPAPEEAPRPAPAAPQPPIPEEDDELREAFRGSQIQSSEEK